MEDEKKGLTLDKFGEAVGEVPDRTDAFFQVADSRDVAAAKSFFEFGNSLPGVTDWGAGRCNTSEVVETTVVFDGVSDGSPLESVGRHEVSVFVAGSTVKVGGNFAKEGYDNTGDYFFFMIGVVDKYIF